MDDVPPSSGKRLEDLRIFREAERLADSVWKLVQGWDRFERDTVGKQLMRAVDSIGANIAEGYGRGSYADNRRFVRIARGSLYETKFFLRRAFVRNLIVPEQAADLEPVMSELPRKLNAYLRSIGSRTPVPTPPKDE